MREQRQHDTGIFDAPQFTSIIRRLSSLKILEEKISNCAVLAVEGLPGSGKSYLVSSLATTTQSKTFYWYDPQAGESLDDFLVHIEVAFDIPSLSQESKCKELLYHLNSTNSTLVIDDFHNVNQDSYAKLIEIATKNGTPARLILISRSYVETIKLSTSISRYYVTGFDPSEVQQFLTVRGLSNISSGIIKDLIDKTDGLPFAASLFATLVRDFGRDPEKLLKGQMIAHERLRTWFSEVTSVIGVDELRLLEALSLAEGAFNRKLTTILGEKQSIEDIDSAFDNLQRIYLVQRYSRYRWTVHHLVALLCENEFSDVERKEIHNTLGRYYLSMCPYEKGILDEENFSNRIRACRQFQRAENYNKSQTVVFSLIQTAKARGHYSLFTQLCAVEMRSEKHNLWLDYHYAHCCFIMGRLRDSHRAIERLLYSPPFADQNKRLAVTRLYADILLSMGQPDVALSTLRQGYRTLDMGSLDARAISHAQTTEIQILIELRKLADANEICELVLRSAAERGDILGVGVALTLSGILDWENRLPITRVVRDKFETAVGLFRQAEDLRGYGWAGLLLAQTELELGRKQEARRRLLEALQVKAEIGDCSMTYRKILSHLRQQPWDRKALGLIDAAIRKIDSVAG